MIKQAIRKGLRLRPDLSLSFYLLDFIFRKILRQNADVGWAVHHTSTIRCPQNIQRGKGCWPGDSPNVYINARNGIALGDHTNIGPGVSLISANHDLVNNAFFTPSDPIRIGKYCWLGSGATILPAVCLGDFTIVGAGAIVTKSFESGYCVIAGNPARVIKQLDKGSCRQFANEQ